MKSRKPTGSFAPHEVQRFILPITLTSLVTMVSLILVALLNETFVNFELIAYGCLVIAGTLINNAVIVRSANFRESYGWLNAVLSGIGLGLLTYVLPQELSEISHIMIILGTIAVAIISGRPYGYITLLIILILNLPSAFGMFSKLESFLDFSGPYIVSFIVMEAVLRIKESSRTMKFN